MTDASLPARATRGAPPGFVSFVVPAHNEQAFIGRTLACLHEAAGHAGVEYEIIVVNDASTDGTADVAAAFGATVVPVRCRRISAVRNVGFRRARGDIVVFVDADTVVPAATLRAALDTLAEGAVGGGARLRFEGQPTPGARLLAALANLIARLRHWSAGCFIFVRRSALPPGDPFDERYYAGEEIIFSDRMKKIGRYVILPEYVLTSDRKVARFGSWRILWALIRLALAGRRTWQNPDTVRPWWYDSPEAAPNARQEPTQPTKTHRKDQAGRGGRAT